MTELESFLKVIADAPGDKTARAVFADWLEEHSEAVPHSEMWARAFRNWTPEVAHICDVEVNEDTKSLHDLLWQHSGDVHWKRVLFNRLRGDGCWVKAGWSATDCVARDCGGYGFSVDSGGLVYGCIATGCTSGGFRM